MAPTRSILGPRTAHRGHRHVKFCTDEKTHRRPSRVRLDFPLRPVDTPWTLPRINAVRSDNHMKAMHKDVGKNTEYPMPKAHAKSKFEATANADVKWSTGETFPVDEIEEWSERKDNEGRKRRLRIRMRSKCKAQIDDEESINEKKKKKPRVAVKLYDGRDSWPLEISKWYLSDHGQLLLSCVLPTQTKSTESQRHQQTIEAVMSTEVQNNAHREIKRKHENQDLVTLFERSAISRPVFQTQPPRHINSETHIWSPMTTPTLTLTPVVTPSSPPMTPTTPEKTTSPGTLEYWNTCLLPGEAEDFSTNKMQSFPTMAITQKAIFTQRTPSTRALDTTSSTSVCANLCNAFTKRERIPSMMPLHILDLTSSKDKAVTCPKINPTASSNSILSETTPTTIEASTSPTMIPTETSLTSTISQIMPMMGAKITPIEKETPNVSSKGSTMTSEINNVSTPFTEKTSIMSEDMSNIRQYRLTDSKSSLTLMCKNSMQQPNTVTTMSSAMPCLAPQQQNTIVSQPPAITSVQPRVYTEVATRAPSSVMPMDDVSLVEGSASISQTTQKPHVEEMKLPEDQSCLTSLTRGSWYFNKGTFTIGAHNAAGVSVDAHDMNNHLAGNNTFNHSSRQTTENVSGTHRITSLEKNTANNKSKLEATQQMLRRLTVDIQAQHARICNNKSEIQPSQNSLQTIGAESDLPDGLQESNTQLSSVSLIIHRNQGSSEPLTKCSNTDQPSEINLPDTQPPSTITWRFWQPQSASWFTVSLPDKNAHQILQSAEPVKRNLENLLQSALNYRDSSVNSESKLAETEVLPKSANFSTDILNKQQEIDNVDLDNKQAPNIEWRLAQLQNEALMNKALVNTSYIENTQEVEVQCPEPTCDPQMQSSSEGEVTQMSPVPESQSRSALPIENNPNNHSDQRIKMEEGASASDLLVLNQLSPSPVVWRLWDPKSGSWVSLNISKANPEQLNESQEAHTQVTNKGKETGESIQGPKENGPDNLYTNDDNGVQKHENILPKSQSQKPEASSIVFKTPLKTEKQTGKLCNETDPLLNCNKKNHSLLLDIQTEKESSSATNAYWSDNGTSFLESTSEADTWAMWPSSSAESVKVRKTRDIKCSSRYCRHQRSGRSIRPRCSTVGIPSKTDITRNLSCTQSNQKANSTVKRSVLRHPHSGTKTSLRSQVALKRWLQRRQKANMSGRSNHRLNVDRWRWQRPLVNTDYNWRRSGMDPQETVTIKPADDANLRSVETPSLLLLCLTADNSLLPKARHQRSNKKTYCIVQSATIEKFGDPEHIPWKRASRQWRRNLANDKVY